MSSRGRQWKQGVAFGMCASVAVATPILALAAEPTRATLQEVTAAARTGRVAADPEWLRLLHYQTDVLGYTSSEVSRGAFFLSPHGDVDAESELVATLSAFFAPIVPGQENEHALCRFPARRVWLEHELHFLGRAQVVHCPELDDALVKLAPTGVRLVYASTYLGNPASAFGHAFLHLTTRAGDAAPRGSEESDDNDKGIEYRAITNTKNPLLYAFEGIAGRFPGRVELPPYNEIARRYTGEQGRDLWEYELALTEDEVTFLLLHIWELRGARIDYYYLTRNCAFETAALLETAAPRFDLVHELKALVVPVDVVRAISAAPGLVRGVAYRPSLDTRLHTRLAALTNTEQLQVRRLLHEPATPWPGSMAKERRSVVLDAALFELDAHYSKDLESLSMNDAKRRWLALMARREGPVPGERAAEEWQLRPDLAHGPMRVTAGTGLTSQYGDSFGSIGYRLALHDLSDPAEGWPELAQVVILDARMRYSWTRRALTVDRLTFADLLSLSPIAPAEPRVSFRVRAFGERLHDRDCADCFAHGADGSVGVTVASPLRSVAFFVMADAYVAFLPRASGVDSSVVRLGVGPYGGVRLHCGDAVAFLSGTVSYLPGEKIVSTYNTQLSINYSLRRDLALGLELAAQPLSTEGQLSSYLYF